MKYSLFCGYNVDFYKPIKNIVSDMEKAGSSPAGDLLLK